jgi:hypothetical protein
MLIMSFFWAQSAPRSKTTFSAGRKWFATSAETVWGVSMAARRITGPMRTVAESSNGTKPKTARPSGRVAPIRNSW